MTENTTVIGQVLVDLLFIYLFSFWSLYFFPFIFSNIIVNVFAFKSPLNC